MKKWAARVLGIGLALSACGTPTTPPDDSGTTDASNRTDAGACASCDDGLFCNGTETCVAGHCAAGTSPCLPSQTCDEAGDRCTSACSTMPDADHDGVQAIACGGTDCDDTNPGVHPGIIETCDTLNVDEDCDPTTYGAHDADGDGHDAAICCNGTHCGDDCDDLRIDVFLGASETCNGRDDDCDGGIDEELGTNNYYADCDGDAYGSAVATPACSIPMSAPSCLGGAWVTTTGDCDDTRSAIHLGAAEICNGFDDDCNGTTDDQATVDALCTTTNPLAVHATVVCTSGACALGSCASGLEDCDHNFANGCEIDTNNDSAHCGACGTACGAAATCSAGVCTPLVDIDAGGAHTCALYASGRAICWGKNNEGQLGDGTRTTRYTAVPVIGGITFQFLEAGGYRQETDLGTTDYGHTCGNDVGGIYCWGRGMEGQIGNGLNNSSAMPVVVANLPMSGGTDLGPPFFLGVSAGGTLAAAAQSRPHTSRPISSGWTWGTGATAVASNVPIQASGVAHFTGVGAGLRHACFLSDDDGGVYCMGTTNTYGELGSFAGPSTTLVRSTFTPSGFWATQVAAGGIVGSGRYPSGQMITSGSTTCARSGFTGFGGGPVYCWGASGEGQLGNGGAAAGTAVTGITDATDISVGGRHACALRATGQVLCWGSNYFGQLGNGGGPDSNVPVVVTGIGPAVAVTAGGEHSCAVLADGSAWCWGHNDSGQLGSGLVGGFPVESSVPVRVLGT